jgi:aspartyl protease family protein
VLKDLDGHYWADALIEGRAVRVMVDTGASVVALTRNDAARLGLKLTSDDFSAPGHRLRPRPRRARSSSRPSPSPAPASNASGPGRRAAVAALPAGHELSRPPLAFTATPASLTLRP